MLLLLLDLLRSL